ncbi:Signal peptide peptidase-like 2C [Vulpes lagopus]
MAHLGFLLLLLTSTTARRQYGVVHVVSETWSKDYCVLFSSDYVTLPRDLHHAPLLPLHDGTAAPWCPGKDSPAGARPLRQATAVLTRANCSLDASGWLAQGRGALGLLLVSRLGGRRCSDRGPGPQERGAPRPRLPIPVAELRHSDLLDILRHTHGSASVRVALYAPPEPGLDCDMVVIFLLAVGTVAAGGYWAGLSEADRLRRGARGPGGAAAAPGAAEEGAEDAAVDFTPAMAGAVVTMSCSVMLLLYFFYDGFVYVLIATFGLGAGTGLYSCLAPLARRLPPQRPRGARPQLPLLLLAGLCALVTAAWVAHRNEDRWAWLLQDTLGVAYCLFVLRRVRLPTLKNCASFLLALLAFDVFFVFITPLLTRTGESIMVEVASGPVDSSSHERLPMVLRVPRLSFSALTLCDQPFSILGFGDIVVPGFLVAYCHRFDVQIRSRQVYFVACTAAYAVGLLVTFVAMVLMQMGQPALLYLVSSTLLTSLAVAACRQELTLFWTGQPRAKTPAQPVAGLHDAPSFGSEQKQEETADVHTAGKLEGATGHLAGDLDSNLEEDEAEATTASEDEASGLDVHSDSSEGWSDANLDPDELPQASPGSSEELVPLMPPPSVLGQARAQAQAQAHDTGLPWMGLHKRKGGKVQRSMSTHAPL